MGTFRLKFSIIDLTEKFIKGTIIFYMGKLIFTQVRTMEMRLKKHEKILLCLWIVGILLLLTNIAMYIRVVGIPGVGIGIPQLATENTPIAPQLPTAPQLATENTPIAPQLPTAPQTADSDLAEEELTNAYKELKILNNSLEGISQSNDIKTLEIFAESLYEKSKELYNSGNYRDSIIYSRLCLEAVLSIQKLIGGE